MNELKRCPTCASPLTAEIDGDGNIIYPDLKSPWIPVSERLPEIYEKVVLFTQHNRVVIGKWLGYNDFAADVGYPVLGQCKPTHWQPIAEMPE